MVFRGLRGQAVEQSNSTGMLVAISVLGKHLYEGTVDPVVAKRRARNRAARKARRVTR